MAPRRRPRKGNTRMDAAISAMSQYGFDRKVVQATVKELLKVYNVGDKGWPFIEGDSYAVLIEAILGEQEPIATKRDAAPKEDAPRDDGCPHDDGTQDDATCGNATSVVETSIAETSVTGTSSTVLLSSFSNLESTDCVSQTTVPVPDPMDCLPVDSVPQRRRRPSYGWIGSDDEEERVEQPVELTMDRLKELAKLLIRPVETKKRKTRWDVKPEDM